MIFELAAGLVEIPPDGRLLQRSVHAFDLTIGPGVVGPSEAMLDAMSKADPVEGMASPAGGRPVAVLGQVGELDAVVRQNRMYLVGDGRDQRFEEGPSRCSGRSQHVNLDLTTDLFPPHGPVLRLRT